MNKLQFASCLVSIFGKFIKKPEMSSTHGKEFLQNGMHDDCIDGSVWNQFCCDYSMFVFTVCMVYGSLIPYCILRASIVTWLIVHLN